MNFNVNVKYMKGGGKEKWGNYVIILFFRKNNYFEKLDICVCFIIL